jgi:hypothetical protein
MVYWPLALVDVLYTEPVGTCVATMVAPGRVIPFASLMVPVKLLVVTWAKAAAVVKRAIIKKSKDFLILVGVLV